MSRMHELLKDFNEFEALYRTQEELATQVRAYNRPGQLGREDQLALKELAVTEKQVGDVLDQLEERLRADANSAKGLFPKAAQSAMELADDLRASRLQPLARQATSQMLAANGESSFGLAERLRSQMEKLFSNCQGGNCPSSDELDTYLKLQRALRAGRNFAQMSRSRKFGLGPGEGLGLARGEGWTGSSGFAAGQGASMKVLGNEMAARSPTASVSQSSRLGKGPGAMAGKGGTADTVKSELMKGLNPINRQSGAVAAETGLEEYSDLVDNYFKAITTRKAREAN